MSTSGFHDLLAGDASIPSPRTAPERGMLLDGEVLLSGYLRAVARHLERRGITVRAQRVREGGGGGLSGLLTLAPELRAGGSRWPPAALEWRLDRGWSATLLPADDETRRRCSRGVQRYLPRALVPSPEKVAHFVAALNADEHTIWACATFRPPRRTDRRYLLLQLSRFAEPEPWQPPTGP